MGEKITLNEHDQRAVDSLIEEFMAKGGMSSEELISRLDAIPLEVFMANLKEKFGSDR